MAAAGTLPLAWPAGENGAADIQLEFALPHEEGVYELHLTAGARRLADVEFVIQLVVFDAAHPSGVSEAKGPEKLVDSFVPGTSMFRKVALDRSHTKTDQSWARIWKLPRHRDEAANGSAPTAAADAGDANSVAYRLKVSHPGRPHRLELVLSGTADEQAVCRLMEADGQGNYLPIGPPVAISPVAFHADGSRIPDETTAETHACPQIFWPNEREPVVLIAGRPDGHPIEVRRIELYEMGERLAALRTPGFDHTSLEWKQRLAGLHLSSFELARNFGSLRVFDAVNHRPDGNRMVDDWQTYWTAGNRLTDYLRYQRLNALMLSVPPINGDSPAQADPVELLLRLFDREDLVLVPELAFHQPLPAVEHLLRHSSDADGSDAIGDCCW